MKNRNRLTATAAAICSGVAFVSLIALAQEPPPSLASLKGVPVPEPSALGDFIKDRQMARVLGKALFWDMAVGSDGVQACASCHFNAGADNRIKNQLGPALNHTAGAPTSTTFNATGSGGKGGPNYTMKKADFPFHQLDKPNDRNSKVKFDTNDALSSQGVFRKDFVSVAAGADSDNCQSVADSVFHVGGINTRRVEPRNTPTTINAVFNFRNFWDGRANNVFNGVNPFGLRDVNARIHVAGAGGALQAQAIALENSSLASQAVGPPLSDFEMSCANRLFPQLAQRLLTRRALANQQVHGSDSVLGGHRDGSGAGLSETYVQLIQAAFRDKYWSSSASVNIDGKNYTQMEANFSLFFGLALQMYQSLLVSDDAPIDRYLDGDSSALTAQEVEGMSLFVGKGRCVECHNGPQLTSAGTPTLREHQEGGLIERMPVTGAGKAHYDLGFYNIGVRPTVEDLGVGGKDPFGNPLSFTRQYKNLVQNGTPFVDPFRVDPCQFEIDRCKPSPAKDFREAVDGAFKTSGLRNVELTGPYFHNGGQATLEQVLAFYGRSGDRRGADGDNTSGFGAIKSNLDVRMKDLKLDPKQQAALVAFLKRPLTDDRVRCDQAPFDHPQLFIPNGHGGSELGVVVNALTGTAQDTLVELPAVGSSGFCPTVPARKPFTDLLPN